MTYGVYIAQLKGMKTHEFKFYDSIHNTHSLDTRKAKDLLYDILACIESEYYIDLSEDVNEQLCLDTSSINEAHLQLGRIIEHVTKLHQLFSESEIRELTENDDRLKNFVENLKIKHR